MKFLILVFSVLVLRSSCQRIPLSPCLNIMRYEYAGTGWIGVINVPNPPPYGSTSKLIVEMSIPGRLGSNFVGRIELGMNAQDVWEHTRRGWPIRFIVRFPIQNPLPWITGVVFNNERICFGPPAIGYYTSNILLEYTLVTGYNGNFGGPFPSNRPGFNGNNIYPFNPLLNRPGSIAYNFLTDNYINRNPIGESPLQDPDEQDFNNLCGKIDAINPLIFNGNEIERGYYPWLVAILKIQRNEFICAGSLITNRHVLTAGQCFYNTKYSIRDAYLKLGAHNLNQAAEEGSESRAIVDIKWKNTDAVTNDIAILLMSSPVTFTYLIRPVCLWSESDDINLIVDKKAYVVGWGYQESGELSKNAPRQLSVPIVSANTCKASDVTFIKYVNDNTLCAGARDGKSGPCRGDSGGGLYMQRGNRWTIRGVISIAIKLNDKCDFEKFAIYTDVAKFLAWIRETITNK